MLNGIAEGIRGIELDRPVLAVITQLKQSTEFYLWQ